MSTLWRASLIRLIQAWKMEGLVVPDLNSSPSGMLSTRTTLTQRRVDGTFTCNQAAAQRLQTDAGNSFLERRCTKNRLRIIERMFSYLQESEQDFSSAGRRPVIVLGPEVIGEDEVVEVRRL